MHTPGPRCPFASDLAYIRSPFRFYARMAERFGRTFLHRTALGPVLHTGDPAHIQQIFGLSIDRFDVMATGPLSPLVNPNSLIVSQGEPFTTARRALAPLFGPRRVRAWAPMMQAAVDEAIDEAPLNTPINLHRQWQRVALDIILRALIGAADREAWSPLRSATLDVIWKLGWRHIFARFTRIDLGPVTAWGRFRAARRHLDALLRDAIVRRRARRAPIDPADPNVLDELLALGWSDDAILDQLLMLVFAGHQTTGAAVCWVTCWLHDRPDVRERVDAELDALPDPASLDTLPYLDAFCHETLRFWPMSADISMRKLRQPTPIGPYVVPAGTSLNANIFLAHRDPQSWPDPDVFRPERFLHAERSPHRYLPFGGGARHCFGEAFALQQMKIAAATLRRRVVYELGGAAPAPARHNLVLGVDDRLWWRILDRAPVPPRPSPTS